MVLIWSWRYSFYRWEAQVQGVKSRIWATKQNLNPDPVPKPCSFHCIRSQGPSFRQSPAFMEIVQITPPSSPMLLVLPSSPLLDTVFCFLSCNIPSPTPILWILILGLDLKDSPKTFCFSCPWTPGARSSSQPAYPVQGWTCTYRKRWQVKQKSNFKDVHKYFFASQCDVHALPFTPLGSHWEILFFNEQFLRGCQSQL